MAKKSATTATRRVRYDGLHDQVDMRPVVGFAPGSPEYDSDEARKFVFYTPASKVDPARGARQFREGVEMTEDQALEILTSPYRVWGFSDISHLFNDQGELLDTGEGFTAAPPANEGFTEVAPMLPLNDEEQRQFAAAARAQTLPDADAPAGGTAEPAR